MKAFKFFFITFDIDALSIFLNVVFFAMLASTFTLFRYINEQEVKNVEANIVAVLRNEMAVSNSYALAKSLSDMEKIGFFECANLAEQSATNRIFYDTLSTSNCSRKIDFFYKIREINLKGLSGVGYVIKFKKSRNFFSDGLEFLLYMFFTLIGFYLPKKYLSFLREEKRKYLALEIQKQQISDVARRVSHDVASPLSSIQMMVSLIKDINPEIRSILSQSLAQTSQIFSDLKDSSSKETKFSPREALDYIVQEKIISINNQILIRVEYQIADTCLLVGNRSQFLRIMSNVLNNSIEALHGKNNGIISIIVENTDDNTVEISITDNGIGMQPELLSVLGDTEITFGKEKFINSGSGIGIYSAKKILSEWDASIFYNSAYGEFTTVKLTLKKAIS